MLRVEGLRKGYRVGRGWVEAIRGVQMDVATGEFVVLLGPSGCGKTTTLRCLAGLEVPDAGEIAIDGHPVFSASRRIAVSPENRPIAMVFQSYAVWPHMTVHDNVAFPLRAGLRRVPPAEAEDRVRQALDLLGLHGVGSRPVTALSGGQQQRVAVARAIALRPKLLLMDEPMSNLDFKLRAHLRRELKDLVRGLGLTTVYVTHDQTEALEMGDRIAVLHEGTIVQQGRPREVYETPGSVFVAQFVGEMNLLEGEVVGDHGDGYLWVRTPAGVLSAVSPASPLPPGSGRGRCCLAIRPEAVRLLAEPSGGGAASTEEEGEAAPDGGPVRDAPAATGVRENVLRGPVVGARYLGEAVVVEVKVPGAVLRVKTASGAVPGRGSEVVLELPADACRVVA